MKLSNDKKTKVNKKLEPSLASVQALGDLQKEGRTKWRAASASKAERQKQKQSHVAEDYNPTLERREARGLVTKTCAPSTYVHTCRPYVASSPPRKPY